MEERERLLFRRLAIQLRERSLELRRVGEYLVAFVLRVCKLETCLTPLLRTELKSTEWIDSLSKRIENVPLGKSRNWARCVLTWDLSTNVRDEWCTAFTRREFCGLRGESCCCGAGLSSTSNIQTALATPDRPSDAKEATSRMGPSGC
jgi:hypothetical protein